MSWVSLRNIAMESASRMTSEMCSAGTGADNCIRPNIESRGAGEDWPSRLKPFGVVHACECEREREREKVTALMGKTLKTVSVKQQCGSTCHNCG